MSEDELHKKTLVGSRKKIVDAAKIEFAGFGLAGARVDRIADRAGVNKAMLYYHFKSKDELYRLLIRQHIESFTEPILEKARSETSLEGMLEILVESHYTFFNPENGYILPIFLREIAAGGGHFFELFEQSLSRQGLVGRLIEFFERGVSEGRFRKIEGRQALISFIGMNLFYLMMSPLVNKIWDITDEKQFRDNRKKMVVDLFLHGIEVKE